MADRIVSTGAQPDGRSDREHWSTAVGAVLRGGRALILAAGDVDHIS